jgi:hypothetical protein
MHTAILLALQAQDIAASNTSWLADFTPLETTKLVVDALMPLVVLMLGLIIHRLTTRIEHLHWINQKLIERRLAVYDAMAPQLNDIMCFCTFVGTWQQSTPQDMLERKRELDRHFYVSAALFSRQFDERYQAFINTCFKTYGGHGRAARLRIGVEYRQEHLKTWCPEWSEFFVSPSEVERRDVRDAYKSLMAQFSQELGLVDGGRA